MTKLTAVAVRNAKPGSKLRKLSDGKGLQLWIYPDGAKRWRYSYRFGGKQRTLALGVYPEVSLSEARDSHVDANAQVRKGIDPGQARAIEKQTRSLVAAETFEAIGREWFERHMENLSESHRVRTLRILEKDLYPRLGSRPIREIEPPEVLAVLRRIENRTVDIAHRAQQAAGQVFRYAVITGRAERDPTADLRGALKKKAKVHYPALTKPSEVGELLVAIDEDRRTTPETLTAIKLAALTFQRPGLIVAMEWEHIDWQRQLWDIPEEAMQKTAKADEAQRPHIVPLSDQAISLLEELRPLTGRYRFVFPSKRRGQQHVTGEGLNTALARMGYRGKQVTHGFRATARTLLDEELKFRVDYIEHQLAHAVRDANGRAYNRTTHIKERRKMMQDWADYLDNLKKQAGAGNVVTARFGAQQGRDPK